MFFVIQRFFFIKALHTKHSFGGTGATISYSDTSEAENVDVVGWSTVISTDGGETFASTVTYHNFGKEEAKDSGYADESETSNATETGKLSVRSRGFTLGDPDDGDYFDVQVCFLSTWVASDGLSSF